VGHCTQPIGATLSVRKRGGQCVSVSQGVWGENTPINSSYYTGIEWIDEKLAGLYERQGEIETELRHNACGLFDERELCKQLIAEHGEVIRRQDALLRLGRTKIAV